MSFAPYSRLSYLFIATCYAAGPRPVAAQVEQWPRLLYARTELQRPPEPLPPKKARQGGSAVPALPLLMLNNYPVPATFYVARLQRYCTAQDFLALLPLSRIQSVQRLEPQEFQARYGLSYSGAQGGWVISARTPQLTADLRRYYRTRQ